MHLAEGTKITIEEIISDAEKANITGISLIDAGIQRNGLKKTGNLG
jgi:hypothetical protein